MECNSDSELPRNNTNKAKYLNYCSGKPNPMNRLVWFTNQSRWWRKDFKKLSEPSLEIQESNKTNIVQFRLRMTKNQHKQSKLLKLPFQQTEPNEPIDLVSQLVQTVEKRFQKNSEPSLQIQESITTNGNRFSARMNKNQPKPTKLPKLPILQT